MEPSFITDENIPRADPMIPNSTGGLLAEEWTIDPDSTLPSFLEMTMMDETRRQGYQTLKWVFEQMEERLLSSSSSSSSSSSETTATESTMISWWSRIRSQLSLYIANNILRPYGPELRFLIMYLLQRRSLLSNSSSATISEALYGGRRVKLGPSSGGGETNSSSSSQQQQQQQQKRRLLPMSKQDAIRLAFLYSFGPYLAERCEAVYRRLSQPSRQSTRIPLKLKKILKVIYPFLHMSVQGVHLLNRWGYLLGQSFFFDGYSRYLNLIVRRTTMEDQQQQQQSTTTTTTPDEASATTSTPMDALKETILKSPKFRQVAIGILSSTAAMSWLARLWAARNDIEQEMRAQQLLSMQSQETKKDLFPPHPLPIPPLVLDSSSNNNNNKNISYKACPICQLPRVNPTASTSGYVFCLKCLLTHIRTTPTCPVTGRPCPEKSIVQLFEPHLG